MDKTPLVWVLLEMVDGLEDQRSKADVLADAIVILAEVQAQATAEIVARALATIAAIEDKFMKARVLCRVAQARTQEGQQAQALRDLQDSFIAAHLAGRSSVFDALQIGAETLAAIDHGETLSQISDAVLEVEGWWGI